MQVLLHMEGGQRTPISNDNNYNANSRAAVIFGLHTNKLLFLGVRNKYCFQWYSREQWPGSSTTCLLVQLEWFILCHGKSHHRRIPTFRNDTWNLLSLWARIAVRVVRYKVVVSPTTTVRRA